MNDDPTSPGLIAQLPFDLAAARDAARLASYKQPLGWRAKPAHDACTADRCSCAGWTGKQTRWPHRATLQAVAVIVLDQTHKCGAKCGHCGRAGQWWASMRSLGHALAGNREISTAPGAPRQWAGAPRDRRTVQRYVRALEALGHVHLLADHTREGRYRSCLWAVNFGRLEAAQETFTKLAASDRERQTVFTAEMLKRGIDLAAAGKAIENRDAGLAAALMFAAAGAERRDRLDALDRTRAKLVDELRAHETQPPALKIA